MAKEVELYGADTAGTYYALIRRASDKFVWNGTAFEVYSSANYATYVRTLTQQGATGNYFADLPTLVDGTYTLDFRSQQGGSPAESDLNSGVDAALNWTGTARIQLNSVRLDLTQAIPTTNTAQTVGDAMNAARAQGFGKWTLVGTSLTMYAADGTTVVRTFTLDSATVPSARV